jgi:hypothetical protein
MKAPLCFMGIDYDAKSFQKGVAVWGFGRILDICTGVGGTNSTDDHH